MHDDQARLKELLARWQSLRDHGQTVAATVMCAGCPELLPEFARKIEAILDSANLALRTGSEIPQRYWRYHRRWTMLGIPAFVSLVIVFYLMVAKPA